MKKLILATLLLLAFGTAYTQEIITSDILSQQWNEEGIYDDDRFTVELKIKSFEEWYIFEDEDYGEPIVQIASLYSNPAEEIEEMKEDSLLWESFTKEEVLEHPRKREARTAYILTSAPGRYLVSASSEYTCFYIQEKGKLLCFYYRYGNISYK